MSRFLLIAVCCIVAAICLFDSVQGMKPCEKRCKATCGRQHRKQNRNLKRCELKCQAQAAVCEDCTSPSRCLKCKEGNELVGHRCVGAPAVRCLAGIQVYYLTHIVHESREIIKEFHGLNNSVNYGFLEGFIVWLMPFWQSGRDNAVTGIDVIITSDKNEGLADVSKGDTLQFYRYLDMVREPATPCITDIALWRSETVADIPDADGWQGNSTDINDRRGGGYLYLVWKYA